MGVGVWRVKMRVVLLRRLEIGESVRRMIERGVSGVS